ncbi:MAG: hypothetical protein JXR96_18890 [Deltaproteobacteria bacterium]|nr:hypothetical protein [Deltaproteobacteria bacterium]
MRRLRTVILLAAVLGGGCGGGDPQEGPETLKGHMLIVSSVPMEEAAAAYRDFRESSGYEVELTSAAELAGTADSLVEALGARIATFAESVPAESQGFVLLLGTADRRAPESTDHLPVAEGYGGALGDSPHVDLDGDDIPDLPIGRLPLDSADSVQTYIDRVRTHEEVYVPGEWNKRISAYAGEGGFGAEVDAILEMLALQIFEEFPPDFDFSMTYAADGSDYYLPPDAWQDDYRARYQAGALLQPYMGHTLGYAECCDGQRPRRRGLVTYFSCSDGEFQYNTRCLATEVLDREHGPVCTLAGSDVTHPYANAVLPRELGHALLNLGEPTYGQALATAKYNMVHRIDEMRRTIDQTAEPFLEGESTTDLIYTHIVMYNLLGDPAAAVMAPPGRLRFDLSATVLTRGGTVTVSGKAWEDASVTPMGSGQVVASLQARLSVIPGELQPRSPSNHDPDLCRQNHAVANDKVVSQATGEIADGAFELQLAVPAEIEPASYFVKVFASDETADAMASEAVRVQ